MGQPLKAAAETGSFYGASPQHSLTVSDEIHNDDPGDPFGEEIDERLRSVKNPTERRTIAGLLREIGRLPLEQTRAALETSAAIAGVSLRASIEFLRAAPEVAHVLEPRSEEHTSELQSQR